mmetsp:Transcript_10962/g.23023  ORF Transcript_10962/g.23023 Transcript_10962/m.23023 type:complete len:213 (+) Transcript_10962:221-859(+)
MLSWSCEEMFCSSTSRSPQSLEESESPSSSSSSEEESLEESKMPQSASEKEPVPVDIVLSIPTWPCGHGVSPPQRSRCRSGWPPSAVEPLMFSVKDNSRPTWPMHGGVPLSSRELESAEKSTTWGGVLCPQVFCKFCSDMCEDSAIAGGDINFDKARRGSSTASAVRAVGKSRARLTGKTATLHCCLSTEPPWTTSVCGICGTAVIGVFSTP